MEDESNLAVAEKIESFDDMPLSDRTKNGLSDAGFVTPTRIQRDAIPVALEGKDILGAAKTGSGKTLAFLVPVLEKLNDEGIMPVDGLACLVLSPTRELALQIFEVLRKIGVYHNFSAGLVIGGNDAKEEGLRIAKMNILIATPGRILAHLDSTPYFSVDGLQILVLDEADRILDLGFEDTLKNILEHLPKQRQTMLFSATQRRHVRALGTLLNLRRPEFISVHSSSETTTPQSLSQVYAQCKYEEKLAMLWSFIKSHLRQKSIVFLSSCKQVKFVFSTFSKLRPGVPLLAIHGRIKQYRRLAIFRRFMYDRYCVLFCTDLAARGLDFPTVNWVVQVDCPDDVDTYIHRVGRTARMEKKGKALLFVTDSEKLIIERLKERKIPITRTHINPSKVINLSTALSALLVKFKDLNHLAKKALISYVRSIQLQSDKTLFDASAIPLREYAESLGLNTVALGTTGSTIERIMEEGKNRVDKNEVIRRSNLIKRLKAEGIDIDIESIENQPEKKEVMDTHEGNIQEKLNAGIDDDSEVLVKKKGPATEIPPLTLRTSQRKKPTRTVFHFSDDEDLPSEENEIGKESISAQKVDLVSNEEFKSKRAEFLETVKNRLEVTDLKDRMIQSERVQEKHKKKRLREKKRAGAAAETIDGEEEIHDVLLGSGDSENEGILTGSDNGEGGDSESYESNGEDEASDSGLDDDYRTIEEQAQSLLSKRRKMA